MIGKSLGERYGLVPLAAERAVGVLERSLGQLAKPIVEVRAQSLVACVVVDATKPAIELCRRAGLAMKAGGNGVFGLSGPDCVALLPRSTEAERAWLVGPAGPRETKVLLVAGGYALLALDVEAGKVTVRAAPSSPSSSSSP